MPPSTVILLDDQAHIVHGQGIQIVAASLCRYSPHRPPRHPRFAYASFTSRHPPTQPPHTDHHKPTMSTPSERRRVLNRVLNQNPYDDAERPGLWIYLIWLCLTVRKGRQPDFEAVAEETGYSALYLEEAFRELSLHGDKVRALANETIAQTEKEDNKEKKKKRQQEA